MEKLVDRYDDYEKRLESKSSVEAVSMLDDRIKGLEDRLTQFSRSTEEKFVELEKELLHKNEEGDKENEISDKDLIKHVVQEEVNRKTAEERDMENRKRNIIIYGVPEKKADNVSDRKTSEGEFVRDLLDAVFNILTYNERDVMHLHIKWGVTVGPNVIGAGTRHLPPSRIHAPVTNPR